MGENDIVFSQVMNLMNNDYKILVLDYGKDFANLKKKHSGITTTKVHKLYDGVLDPFKVFKDIDISIIIDLLTILCVRLTTEDKLCVVPIAEDFIHRSRKRDDTTFCDFVDYLCNSTQVRTKKIGAELRQYKDTVNGGLLFGKTSKKGFRNKGNNRVLVELNKLVLPTNNQNKTPAEILNLALIYILEKAFIEDFPGEKIALLYNGCSFMINYKFTKDIFNQVMGRNKKNVVSFS